METYWKFCKIWIFRRENKNSNILGYLASEITINTDSDQGDSISTKWWLKAQYWRNCVQSTVTILNLLVYDLVHVTLQLIASQFVNLGVEPSWGSRPGIV